ncbi:MAG: putative bifunctional diguanylate cyclase/phosphodiesterase [Spirulina sp.]
MTHFWLRSWRPRALSLAASLVRPLSFGSRAILVSTLLALTAVSVGKRLMVFQPLEMASFDFLSRLQPAQPPDDRILIVEVTEEDLSRYGWPLSDQRIAEAVTILQRYDPAVIGVDLYRNMPQPILTQEDGESPEPSPNVVSQSEQATLAEVFQSPKVIGIFNVGDQAQGQEVPAPKAWPPDQVGFNDLALDPDGVLRRNLLFVDHPTQPYYSFPLRLAMVYSANPPLEVHPEGSVLWVGDTPLPALRPGDGGYAAIDDRGYQILMHYRTPHSPANKITISQVLAGDVPAPWVQGRAVLIGSTAPSLKDDFLTPYSRQATNRFMLAGVEAHAHALSQLLGALAGESVIYRFLPQWGEFLWLTGWIVVGGWWGWRTRRPLSLIMIVGLAILGLWVVGGVALTQQWWLPTIEPLAGFLLALGLVVTQKALYRTSYDQLTLLPGREMFLIYLQRELNLQRRTDVLPPLTVVFLDIDRFKLINQSFGHSAGDRVLQTMAKRLRTTLPEFARLARVGGDEFAFLLPLNDQVTIDTIIDQVQRDLAEPITIAKQRLAITSTMGMVISRGDEVLRPEDLLRDAHTAMYRAKALSEDRYEVFASTMREEAVRRLALEGHLLHAMENQEFLLYYQPIVCLQTRQLLGFEALIRWYRPEEGFISPGQFVQIAEETGLILPLGQWIFREASGQLKRWQDEFPQHRLKMSINLSRRQFHQPNLVDQFAQCLEDLGLDGRSIQLEITESMIMRNVEGARHLMQQLKALGLQLAIDDFGTGYSSLSYLHRFPTDTLKIDQSFVGRMEKSQDDREIVHTIIALGCKLGMGLVAEGIEEENQVDMLLAMGCERGQGYLFAKPLNVQDATAFIATQSAHP